MTKQRTTTPAADLVAGDRILYRSNGGADLPAIVITTPKPEGPWNSDMVVVEAYAPDHLNNPYRKGSCTLRFRNTKPISLLPADTDVDAYYQAMLNR